jgi:hypothetical protein
MHDFMGINMMTDWNVAQERLPGSLSYSEESNLAGKGESDEQKRECNELKSATR